ncbi:MAG: serine acetyltransferase [Sporolactobacillus sp.]
MTIKNKTDYIHYLDEDKRALGAFTKHPVFADNIMILLTDPCWKFQKQLRRLEYWTNCKHSFLEKSFIWILRKRYQKMCVQLGLTIPINVFDEGLCIMHFGSIVVSRHAKIGKYCTINSGVNIGGTSDGKAPAIGNHCFIGPGAKLFNNICIGDHVKIGANSVVNKSFDENNITIAGAPAKIVDRHSGEKVSQNV